MSLMRYVGYNGVATVEGEILALFHGGSAANVGGLDTDVPQQFPLERISDVAFADATPAVNGHLTLGVNGAAAQALDPASAGSDPQTIQFDWQQREVFQALYGWLVSVVRYNREHGIQPAVPVVGEPAAATGTPTLDYRSAPPPTGPPIVPAAPVLPPVKELSPRQQRAQRRTSFEALANAAAGGDPDALAGLPEALAAARADWRPSKLRSALWQVVTEAVRRANSDDVLTLEEEKHLFALSGALGLDLGDVASNAPELFEELMVCRINDGRPPTLTDPPMLTKRGETAYGAFNAALMKEAVRREFRGGSSGVSIPVGFGVRYRTGRFRGHSVVVGTDLVAEDTGVLVVTNLRSVFAGSKKTLEFRHDRLVGMQQYRDGLRLNVSNRQTASLLKFSRGNSPTICAALITHAVAEI